MNRKQFIESHGATCKNWYWSWSFINQAERRVIIGAWDRNTDGKRAMILSEEWQFGRGRKNPGYQQSREHIRLVEEEGYRLMTFPMKYSDANKDDDGTGPAKIGEFTPELTEKKVTRVGHAWYAADLTESNDSNTLAEELTTPEKFTEGGRASVTINAYERNAAARRACIAHHGCSCAVCDFDFADVYGVLGEGFIHVHHVVSIGTVGKEYEVDPKTDLVPVCPNCHAMIHCVEPILTVRQLRNHLLERKTQTKSRVQ
jgi:5-methylcytosine-specific restriction enzyme A